MADHDDHDDGDDRDDPGFEQFVSAAQQLFSVMSRNRGRLAQARSGLSLSQLGLLDAIVDRGPLPVGEIAAHAGVAGPTATRMLKQLERDGIVTRERSPADERRVMVTLTDRGREIVERQRRSLRSAQRRHYAALTPDQRTLFVDVLEQMATMIDQWSDFTDDHA